MIKTKKSLCSLTLKDTANCGKIFISRLLTYERRNEPRESLDFVRKKLVRQGNIKPENESHTPELKSEPSSHCRFTA
jgi:hypothetical protein